MNKNNKTHLLLGIIIGIFFTAVSVIVLYKVIKNPHSLKLFLTQKRVKNSLKYKSNFGNKGFYLGFEKNNDFYFFTPTENVNSEISNEYATQGKHSLKVQIKSNSEAPGILWEGFRNNTLNWKEGTDLHFNVFSNNESIVQLTIRLKSGRDYPKALYSLSVELQPLQNNHISIPLSQIATSCNLQQISYVKFYVESPQNEIVLFFDNLGIRESTKEDEISNIIDSKDKKYETTIKPDMSIKEAPPLPKTPDNLFTKNEIVTLDPETYKKLGITGRDWYVDIKKGSDEGGDGTSLSPWRTIGKGINSLSPGDALLISAGIYRERLNISKGGTEERRILIGPKGDGEVIIDPSVELKEWSVYDATRGVYQANCPFKPTAVVVDEKPFYPEFPLSNVNSGTWFYDNNKKTIYVCIPGGENPASHEIGVISDDKDQNGILAFDCNYITFYGLNVRYAGGRGIVISGNNNRVERCTFEFNGCGGVSIAGETSKNNQVVKNHIFYNFMRNWPRGRYKSGGWGAGAYSHDAVNTQFIGNVVHNNGGEGLLTYGGQGGTTFRDNVVYDNWSVNIYIDNQPNGIIERNFIFCHDPNQNDLYNNGDDNPSDGKNFRRLRAIGIMTADEDYSLNPPANLNNILIANNIIIDCRMGISHNAEVHSSGLKNVLFAHNTIIIPNSKGIDEEYVGIKVPYNNGNNVNTIYRDNIIYASHPQTYLLAIETNPLGLGNNLTGVTFDHNLWYHASREMPFHIWSQLANNFDTNFKAWQKSNPTDLYADPMLNGVSGYSAQKAELKTGSPAINAGLFIEKIAEDYYNRQRTIKNPTIGAVEFVQKNE